jgi:hypothetical protein
LPYQQPTNLCFRNQALCRISETFVSFRRLLFTI